MDIIIIDNKRIVLKYIMCYYKNLMVNRNSLVLELVDGSELSFIISKDNSEYIEERINRLDIYFKNID